MHGGRRSARLESLFRAILLFTAFAVLAVACGGGGGDAGGELIPSFPEDDPAEDPAPEPAPEPSASEAPPESTDSGSVPDIDESAVTSIDESAQAGEVRGLVRSVDVDQTVRYSGFDVTVNDVAFGFDPAGFRVALVSVTLHNDTPTTDRLQTAIEIESQGTVAFIDRDMTGEVPSGEQADGAFSLRLDAGFTFDDAVLFVGRPDRQRAHIPLGSAGELITRAPQVISDAAMASDEVSTITLDTVTIAWDRADPRGQAEPGEAFLHVDYTLESTVETALNDESVVLVLADGTAIAASSASITSVDTTPTPLTASFLVPDPPSGEYLLRYTERFGRGVVEVPFSID